MTALDSRVRAEPSKHFFIEILTRDVPVEDAILDLVDNSVEAADRCAGGGSLSDYEISILFDGGSEASFQIVDNCGGIDVDTARNHAFCFGRDTNEGHEGSDRPIGRFGVGMKRSMFRLGRVSNIYSTTKVSQFLVSIDTDEWLTQAEGAWHFDFEEVEVGQSNTNTGTHIEVTQLHQNVQELFAEANDDDELIFEHRLRRRVLETYPFQLKRGLKIRVNGGKTVSADDLGMFVGSNEEITPFHKRFSIGPKGETGVTLELIVGVDAKKLSDGGWYVFCNDRLVLARNQDQMTGWGTTGVAKYSDRFARFRGFAIFRSADAKLLPWTTTKRAIDSDSLVYQQGRVQMVGAMQEVMSFLASRDREKKYISDERIPEDQGVIGQALGRLKDSRRSVLSLASNSDTCPSTDFRGPSHVPPSPLPLTSIQFKRPRVLVEKAKTALHADTNGQVGEKLFDMYIEGLATERST